MQDGGIKRIFELIWAQNDKSWAASSEFELFELKARSKAEIRNFSFFLHFLIDLLITIALSECGFIIFAGA